MAGKSRRQVSHSATVEVGVGQGLQVRLGGGGLVVAVVVAVVVVVIVAAVGEGGEIDTTTPNTVQFVLQIRHRRRQGGKRYQHHRANSCSI